MKSNPDSQLNAPSELDLALELASREFDGDLKDCEARQLADYEAVWPERLLQFRTGCRLVRESVADFPVSGAPGLLFRAPDVVSPAVQVRVVAPVASVRRPPVQAVVVGIVTTVLCGILLMALNTDRQYSGAMAHFKADLSANAEHGSEGSLSALALSATDEPLGTLASPAAAEATDPTEVLPLVESEDWHVVVVEVNGGDRDAAMDRIQQIVQMRGLKVSLTGASTRPEWLGVVLSSAEGNADDIADSMRHEVMEPRPSVRRSGAADVSTKRIVDLVKESLKYPTRSELHHGRIIVALPPDNGRDATTRRLVESEAAAKESASLSGATPAAKRSSRSDVTEHSSESDSSIPGPASGTVSEVVSEKDQRHRASDTSAERLPSAVTLILFRFSADEKDGRPLKDSAVGGPDLSIEDPI